MRNQAQQTSKITSGPHSILLSSPRLLPWLLLLFVGSGCAALIYEVVWLQLLQLVVGSTGISLGVLLGTFMGGMCLGSLLLPRLISAGHHPLRVYAFLELGIAIIGVAILFGMPLLADMYAGFMGHGVIDRAIVAWICLLPHPPHGSHAPCHFTMCNGHEGRGFLDGLFLCREYRRRRARVPPGRVLSAAAI